MTITTIPGYSDLFGPSPKTYEQFLAQIPTALVLPLIIGINAEMYSSLTSNENQRRMRNLFSDNFTPAQAAHMNAGYSKYRKANPLYGGEVFGNRYLVQMCIRELNRNNTTSKTELTQEDEFNILQAYLIVVQDLNDADQARLSQLNQVPKDEDSACRLLWEGWINQFEFTDRPHPAYSVYRLLQFSLYSVGAFHKRFKEYLETFHFKTPLEFIGSFTSLAQAATGEFPDKAFRKVSFIHSENPAKGMHLSELDISKHIAPGKMFGLTDIKAYPLFKTKENEYLIFDQQLFLKKIYVGPFFELIKRTGLNKDLGANDKQSFNTYSTMVSANVLEKRCFAEIVTGLRKSKYDTMYFDDGTDSCPDGYYRSGKTIFLIEFKGYVFPAKLGDKPDFAMIKTYLDSRFIEEAGGTAKGIGQLARQIGLLSEGSFAFDEVFNEKIRQKPYTIYPVICHTDYYFSMPGVNDYLNKAFRKKVQNISLSNADVKDLTVIDLVHLFEMISYGSTFSGLQDFIDTYQRRMSARKRLQVKEPGVSHFLSSYAGFDEMYRSHFSQEVQKGGLVRKYITDLINESKQLLQEPL